MPARAQELSETQRVFLHTLAKQLSDAKWEGDALQVTIFNSARLTPIDQPSAFKAIYRVLLDRDNGPKAGNFLSFLHREFVVRRFSELPVTEVKFWEESAVTNEALEQWLCNEKENISTLSAKIKFAADSAGSSNDHSGIGVIEFFATMLDGKTHCKRVLFRRQPGLRAENVQTFNLEAGKFIGQISASLGKPIPLQ